LTVFRHEGIQVHDLSDVLWRAIGGAGYHDAGRAVPDEDDLVQILVFQNVDDVVDVDVEADSCGSEMAPFAEPRQCGREYKVSVLPEQRHHLLPEPAPMPGRVNQNERIWLHRLGSTGHARHRQNTHPASGGPEHVSTRRLRMRGHGHDNAAAGRRMS
jgi:hypothetical protein